MILEVAFLRSDFSFVTVATHSSTTTPFFYKAAAAWSSQEGSLLLWAFLLSVWSSVVLTLTRGRLRDVTPYATAVLLGFAAFFIGLLLFTASPFDTVAGGAPAEGTGLNPLLRHPSMMTHPIALYSGYTLAAVPFAFAIGALIARRIDAEWIAATRRFALASWLALGIGLLLGARWSYVELGWGGYWAWDPVENAALLPWLTATALIHSVQIQEKRGMLKIWNVSLTLATGTLAIVGTFLVRSGILDSIHAFVEQGNAIAWAFTALIAVCARRRSASWSRAARCCASEHRIESLLSREAVFLGNNLVLVGDHLRRLLGHVLPADLRGDHGRQARARAAVVRQVHRAAGDHPGGAVGHRAAARRGGGRPRRTCGATSRCRSPWRSRRWSCSLRSAVRRAAAGAG